MFILVLLLFVVVGGIFLFITFENLTAPTHLMLFGWQTPALSVGLLILFVFLLGALLLYILSFLSARKDRGELKALQERIKVLEQQMMQQRPVSMPMQPMQAQHLPQATNAPLQMPGMFSPPRYQK